MKRQFCVPLNAVISKEYFIANFFESQVMEKTT